MKYLIGLFLSLFAVTSHAADVKPYVFYKSFAGVEEVKGFEQKPTVSSLIEVGLELPKNTAVSYSYYIGRYEGGEEVEIHSVGVSYKFYWKMK